ncbi:cupin domain-containing protein [Thermomonospora umbrina]|uniref:Cupin domain n=1 Tax=Thermomonospora umbrina TaxID=111806 RepID=A0A3D9SPE3_9ACTN|nr:cupin domain-containing protein [Thermomonospora umbrina]REE95833.1 cupin domain [Thermomonospora umbrina]
MRLLHAAALTTLTAATLTMTSETVVAAPRSGATARTVARARVGDRDYVLREIALDPGGSTGWHYHDGPLYARVVRGTLTRTLADCRTTVAHPEGSLIVEPPGPEHVHIGRNLGAVPVLLSTLSIIPVGSPLAHDVPDPGCGYG